MKVTTKYWSEMRQATENKQEKKPFKAVVTAMFHGRRHVLGGNGSLVARENVAPSLSVLLEVISDVVSDASSQLGFLTVVPQFHLSRALTRRRSL
jgi:hypothetical protein